MRMILLLMLCLSLNAQCKRDAKRQVVICGDLIWQDNKEVTQKKLDFNMANSYCKSLNLGKISNWQLPSLEEMILILDYTNKTYINKNFKYYANGHYQSQSPNAIMPTQSNWTINYKSGEIDLDAHSSKNFVRCVCRTF